MKADLGQVGRRTLHEGIAFVILWIASLIVVPVVLFLITRFVPNWLDHQDLVLALTIALTAPLSVALMWKSDWLLEHIHSLSRKLGSSRHLANGDGIVITRGMRVEVQREQSGKPSGIIVFGAATPTFINKHLMKVGDSIILTKGDVIRIGTEVDVMSIVVGIDGVYFRLIDPGNRKRNTRRMRAAEITDEEKQIHRSTHVENTGL